MRALERRRRVAKGVVGVEQEIFAPLAIGLLGARVLVREQPAHGVALERGEIAARAEQHQRRQHAGPHAAAPPRQAAEVVVEQRVVVVARHAIIAAGVIFGVGLVRANAGSSVSTGLPIAIGPESRARHRRRRHQRRIVVVGAACAR